MNSSKQDSDFENEELDEKYLKLFPETNLKSPGIDARFGSEILGSSETDGTAFENDLPAGGKFGSLERLRRNSRELSPLPARRKTDDAIKDELPERDDVFVKPRLPVSRKTARRPLPLDFVNSKVHGEEKPKYDLSENVMRTQSW